MPTINAPFGLNPVMHRSGSPWNGRVVRRYIPSTNNNAFYVGSPVISLAAADAIGVPGVDVGAAGSTYRGVVVGVEPFNVGAASLSGANLDLTRANVPATKLRDYYVYIDQSPDTVFEVQGDATATNQTAANSNKNCQLTIAAPTDTTRPLSATVVTSSTIATTQGHNIRLMGLSQKRPNNDFGAYAIWLCMINQHELMGNTVGI